MLPFRHLAAYHGTNKIHIGRGATGNEYEGVDYAAVYERYLASRRSRHLTLLELGVYRGESLRMWKAYLPRATVLGVDIDPVAADRAPGFEVYIGSQSDLELLDRIARDHPAIDVIVDDASHIPALTVESFRALFPRLQTGGLYFIEDVPNELEELGVLLSELTRDTLAGARRTVAFVHVWPRIISVGRA